jgi:hypothetical protein
MIPDWTLFVLLPAAMGAGVFRGTWLARTGYDNGFRDGFAQAVNDAEMGAEMTAGELEPEPTEQQTMDFLAAVRDDEPGEITGPFVITDADPPRAPRLTAAQRRRAVKKGRIPRNLPGQAGARVTTASESSGAVIPAAEADEPLYPLEMARAAVGLAGELHHEPPTLERAEAVGTLADEIAAGTWLRWQLECDAYRDEMAAAGLFEGMASGWAELLAGFDAIEIPQLEAA